MQNKLSDDEVDELIRETDQGVDAPGNPIDYQAFVEFMMTAPPHGESTRDGDDYFLHLRQ